MTLRVVYTEKKIEMKSKGEGLCSKIKYKAFTQQRHARTNEFIFDGFRFKMFDFNYSSGPQ